MEAHGPVHLYASSLIAFIEYLLWKQSYYMSPTYTAYDSVRMDAYELSRYIYRELLSVCVSPT